MIKSLKSLSIISTFLICSSSTSFAADNLYGAEAGVKTNLGNWYKDSSLDEGPVTLTFRADSNGNLELAELDWMQFEKRYQREEFGGVEIALRALGAKYEKIHDSIGQHGSIQYAHLVIRKAFVLDDGVTLILSGVAKASDTWSVHQFNEEDSRNLGRSYKRIYNQDSVNLDIEATGEIHFKIGDGNARAYAYYKQGDERNFETEDKKFNYSYQRNEYGAGIEYRPSEKSKHTFGLKVKRNEFNENFGRGQKSFDETQFMLTYQYRFDMEEFFFGKSYEVDTKKGDKEYDEYVEEELDLPEFY
ncbi:MULTISPECIES: hypothetical protein [unclassified Halobacteriovorax]|uniref:hypothetical protein n=1 Tax=unclassified Halobacteriovorax TaxID=2639665 RepID=UPI00399A3C6B